MKVARLGVEQWGRGRFILKSSLRSHGPREFYAVYLREHDTLKLRRNSDSALIDLLSMDLVRDDSISVSTVGDSTMESLRNMTVPKGNQLILRSAQEDAWTEWLITLEGVEDRPPGDDNGHVEYGVPKLERIMDLDI
jgi:hypothetical protein